MTNVVDIFNNMMGLRDTTRYYNDYYKNTGLKPKYPYFNGGANQVLGAASRVNSSIGSYAGGLYRGVVRGPW